MLKKLNKPTLKELVYFLTSDQKTIPENFLEYKNELKRLVDYLLELIWNYPKLILYFQKYNDLFNQEYKKDIIEFLKWLQYIFNENDIKTFHLKAEYFNFFEALNKVKDLEKQAEVEGMQLIDLVSRIKVAQAKNENIQINKSQKIENKKRISKYKEKIKQAQQALLEKKNKDKEKKLSSKFLKELNKEIIKEEELTLIDIFVNKTKNEFIYVFINKFSEKRYYKEPFKATFFISKDSSIIKNDYFREYSSEDFYKYTITDYWQFNSLKSLVSKTFKHFKNEI